MDDVRKYQNEKPVESDLFNGQGHKQVADAISKVLLNDSSQHIIGIEGSLGAGKSTVINILEKSLQDEDQKFHIVTFDADQHHTSLRPALIKVIETKLKSILGNGEKQKQEKLSKAVDTALGKRLEYTKKIKSKLPVLSILFFFLLSVAALQVKPSLSFLFEWVCSLFDSPTDKASQTTAELDISNGLLSVSLVFLPALVFWGMKIFGKEITLGDLIKRNSEDTINETIDINREVGSIELKEAFDSFAELIPDNKVLILVIDNIDRVAPDAARELWSDIETLISLGSERLRILLPYSEEHLAKALEKSSVDENQSGKEFISKRIPVPFSAPPIVTTGWHEQFNEYWDQTLSDIKGKDGVKTLIEVWNRKITPRYLKSIVNRIGAKIDSCPEHNDILNGVCCAAYIIAVKDNSLKINELLSKPDELTLLNFDEKSRDDLKRQLKVTQKLLRKHVGDKEEWSKQIAALHFQTSFEIAQSELIAEPIKSAFLSLDSERLVELHPLHGFDLFFKKQIENTHASDLIKIAASLVDKRNESGKAILDAHIKDINHEIKEVDIDDYEMDSDLIEGHEVLAEHDIKIDLTLVKKLQGHVTDDIKEQWKSLKRMDADDVPHSVDSDEWQDLRRSLEECYRYSFRTNITPEFIQKPEVDFIVNVLFPFEAHLGHWNIPGLIKTADTVKMIESACKRQTLFNEEETIFPEILKKLKVGQVEGISQSKLLNQVDLARTSPEHLLQILPFSSDWRSGNKKTIAQQLANNLNKLEGNEELLDEYTALVAAAFVNAFEPNENIALLMSGVNRSQQHNSASWLVTKLKKRPDFTNYLTNYFSACNFADIFKWCKYDSITEYFLPSLETLIQADRIENPDISLLMTSDYPFLKNNFNKLAAEGILKWMGSRSIGANELLSWNIEFFEDVLKYQPTRFLNRLLVLFDGESITSDDWLKRIDDKHPHIEKIIKHLKDSSKKLEYQNELVNALKMLPEQEKSYDIELVSNLLALIDKEKLTSFKRNLSITFLKTQTSYDQRYRSILYFGSLFNMPKIQDELIASDIITFLEDAIANDKSTELDWLLSQKTKGSGWNIGTWSPDNLQGLHDVLKDSEYAESELATLVKALCDGKKEEGDLND